MRRVWTTEGRVDVTEEGLETEDKYSSYLKRWMMTHDEPLTAFKGIHPLPFFMICACKFVFFSKGASQIDSAEI